MKKIIFTIFFTILAVNLYSQTVTVIDKSSLQPINDAILVSGNNTAKTNSLGQADITAFQGADKIEISSVDYIFQTLSYEKIKSMNFVIALTDRSYRTNEIVISANKFDENSRLLPRQIDVLNSRDIKNANTQTTADLMASTGNILVQKSQLGGGSPIIRGFEANKVLIMIDGVRMNNIIFRGGHLQNILRIDQNMLNRAEVLFGSGSTIYGSDALGGVMSFYSKDPSFSLTNKAYNTAGAFFRYSSADREKTGHVNFNLANKKIGFIGSFTFSDFNSLMMGTNDVKNDKWLRKFTTQRINGKDTMIATSNYFLQDPSGYHQYDILGKFMIKQSEMASHTFNFQYSNTNDIPRYDRLNEVSTAAEWYYGPERRILGSYKLNLKSKKGFYDDSKVLLAFQDIKESRNSRSLNSSNLKSRTEKVKVYSLNVDFNKKAKNHNLAFGIEGIYNDLTSTAIAKNIKTGVETPTDTRYPDGGNNMKSFALYIQDMLQFSNKVIGNAGVRYNYVGLHSEFNDTTFFPFPFKEVTQSNSALSGNLGFTFLPKNDLKIYLNGSTGFRAPNVDDLAKVFESTPGSVIVPNPDLKPEYTYGVELGISNVFNNRVKAEAIGYYTWIKDAIITAPFTFNGQDSIVYDGVLSQVLANQNKQSAFIYGINLGLDADITEYLSLINTINYTYGRIDTDSTGYPLDHIPPLFGKSAVVVNVTKFRGEFSFIYNAWKLKKDYNLTGEDNFAYATPDGEPNWFTLNVSAAYQFNRNLQLQLDIQNILDRNYRVFASGINAPGINSVLTIRGSIF